MNKSTMKYPAKSFVKKVLKPLLVALVTSCCLAAGAFAADPSSEGPYSGNFLSRSTLTGDWGLRLQITFLFPK
jgi:hypothetical protein